MTEHEWLFCTDPAPMLEFLRGKASDRRLQLFAVGCCGMDRDVLTDARNRRAVELAERLAEGVTDRAGIGAVRAATRNGTAWCTIMDSASDAAFHAARSAAGDAARSAVRGKTWGGREERDTTWSLTRATATFTQASILRCIFGNPFRPVTLDTAWRTAKVVGLAQAIYDERAFDRLPILADALEEAGCDNAELLGHLRSAGPHVLGCWALDLILGKT